MTMQTTVLIILSALVLVKGIALLAMPEKLRAQAKRMQKYSDQKLRIRGMITILLAFLLLYVAMYL